MGNGYMPGRLDDIGQMRAVFEDLTRRISELEKPMGGLQIPIPVAASAYGNSSGTIGVSTTMTTVCSATVTVPTGFTQAVVYATSQASAKCSVATGDYFTIQCMVTASGGAGSHFGLSWPVPSQSASGTLFGFTQYPQAFANASPVFTGLAGGETITVTCQIQSQVSAWTADPYTSGTCTIQVIFLP